MEQPENSENEVESEVRVMQPKRPELPEVAYLERLEQLVASHGADRTALIDQTQRALAAPAQRRRELQFDAERQAFTL